VRLCRLQSGLLVCPASGDRSGGHRYRIIPHSSAKYRFGEHPSEPDQGSPPYENGDYGKRDQRSWPYRVRTSWRVSRRLCLRGGRLRGVSFWYDAVIACRGGAARCVKFGRSIGHGNLVQAAVGHGAECVPLTNARDRELICLRPVLDGPRTWPISVNRFGKFWWNVPIAVEIGRQASIASGQ
jgi:hypothetical protein